MSKKREERVSKFGFIAAIILILSAAFMSSLVYEAPQAPIPIIESTGRSVTGFAASSFTSTCADDSTIIKTTSNPSGNYNLLAAKYDSLDSSYSKKICSSTLGTGHTCKSAPATTTTTTTTPTTSTKPAYCSDSKWSGDESDQDCGGSCNKCSSGLSCWGNSDCSSGICWFDTATMTKRNAATPPITKDQRLQPVSTNIQYQGACVNTAPSTGGIVGGAIVDVTGEQFSFPSSPSFGIPTAPSYCSDGVKSGDESDKDCGGSCLTKCANTLKCNSNTDCTSNYCTNGICQTLPISFPSATPTIPTISIPTTTTTTTTAAQTPINTIIRIGSDNTVEKAGYSGPAATTTTPTTVAGISNGTITTCSVDRTAQGINTKCTPPAGPVGTKLLGIIDEYNGVGKWYNAFGVYVSDNVNGEIIKCDYAVNPSCNPKACTKGTLQASFTEHHGGGLDYFDYGICADKKIRIASCTETTKGRICTTTSPESGLTKFNGYFTDIFDQAGYRDFIYYDFYGAATETTTTSVATTYSDVCFGSGPYHYEDRTGKTKGACDAGNCIFTISADSGAKVADCSTANAYATSVCSGGYCVGACDQVACQDQLSCNANTNCAFDAFEKNPNKVCKSKAGICNQFGVGLCNPAAFRSGDYSCLLKDKSTGYYTQACVGSGQFGFWQIPETY